MPNTKQLPEYVSRTVKGWEDRRVVELQPDGGRIMRDPITLRAYDISTGDETPAGWSWEAKYWHDA